MRARPLLLLSFLALLGVAWPALAADGQRTDVLTGEPLPPRRANPHAGPDLLNPPQAPRPQQRQSDNPPMEIYITPQVGQSQYNQPAPWQGRRAPYQR